MDFAIIPAIKKLVSVIVASFVNSDIFGYYWISNLFLTGHIFEYEKHTTLLHDIVFKELKRELKDMDSSNGFMIPCIIHINPCCQKQSIPRRLILTTKSAPFCYDEFIDGSLSAISSSAYFLRAKAEKNRDEFYVSICSPIRFGGSSSLLLRGEQLLEKRFKMSVEQYTGIKTFTSNYFVDIGIKHHNLVCTFYELTKCTEIYKFKEPNSVEHTQDINDYHESNADNIYFSDFSKPTIATTICVTPLNYCSCLKISFEYYHHNTSSTLVYEVDNFIIGERQTLAYLK